MSTLTLEDLSEDAHWIAFRSGLADVDVQPEGNLPGRPLRLHFDFHGEQGFVGARIGCAARLPPTFSLSFRIRGSAERNRVELKLIDPSNSNVWRWQVEDFEFTPDGREITLRDRQIEFAWGPAGGGRISQLGAIEFVVGAASGGKGTVWLENLQLIDRTIRTPPTVIASSSRKGSSPAKLLVPDHRSVWRPAAGDSRPWLEMDFHGLQEYGGLIIDWASPRQKRKFSIKASQDGRSWKTVGRPRSVICSRSFVPLPPGEARALRIQLAAPDSIQRIALQPPEFSASQTDFCFAVAAHSQRGMFPRWLLREQSYWTCAGVPDPVTCALINEEGLIEPDKGTFSLEPFLFADRRLHTWEDARRTCHLGEEGLAIPGVRWTLPHLTLDITAFGAGQGIEAVQMVRYRVRNRAARRRNVALLIAIRPFQTNPPWQGWQGLGGISPVHKLDGRSGVVRVNGNQAVIPLSPPDGFGATAFDEGDISEFLKEGTLPHHQQVSDRSGLGSAALRYDLNLAAGESTELFVAVPVGTRDRPEQSRIHAVQSLDGPAEYDEAVRALSARTGTVQVRSRSRILKDAAATFRTAVGQILINRDGPSLQPGPRRYTRSWIRDGAIMCSALLHAGEKIAPRDFVTWYAPFQRKDGFVPCCVDSTGPDWLVEHDSHGQLIFAVMEYFRFTDDAAFVREFWPRIRKAARYIESLRHERLTEEYELPEKSACRGLLPESASHEGYLAHPVHSYWDDFWACRGLNDAAAAARVLGHPDDAKRFDEAARQLDESLQRSVRQVIADRGLNFVPGSVELADFDPTATAIAVSLLPDHAGLPPDKLQATFDQYMELWRKKRSGDMPWNNYSAYEIRIIGALVRLGRRREALDLLEFFLSDRRPRNWHQWPEISWRNPRSPGHLGDVPHTWISAEYLLSFSSLFAYEREADAALVIAAGVDEEWIDDSRGMEIAGLPTRFGVLNLAMFRDGQATRITLGGDLIPPAGGFVLRPPGAGTICRVEVNGENVSTFTAEETVVSSCPADIRVERSV